jgi:hypothetical protein
MSDHERVQRRQRSGREPEHPAPEDSPHFGRLLAVLALAILLIVAITFASEAYFSSWGVVQRLPDLLEAGPPWYDQYGIGGTARKWTPANSASTDTQRS